MAVAQISPSQAIYLVANPGYLLRPDAARAWDRASNAFGKQVLITGALRSYAIQKEIFLDRYQHTYIQFAPGQVDARYWPTALGGDGRVWYRKPGQAAAAVPGTSNHGGGVAVDVKTKREAGDPSYDKAVVFGSWSDADRARFLRVAREYGWSDTEGRIVGELWHLTYYPELDQHKNDPIAPIAEDDMTPEERTALIQTRSNTNAILAYLREGIEDGQLPKGDLQDTARKDLILARRNSNALSELRVEIRALRSTVALLVENAGLDPEAVSAILEAGIANALKDLKFTISNEEIV